MTAYRDGSPTGFSNRLRRAIARLRSDEGSAAAEFAMLSPFIIAIVLASIEVGYIFFAKTELARVAQAAARAVEFNETQNMTQAQFQAMACANIAVIIQCSNLALNVQAQTTSACNTIPTTVPAGAYSPGTNGDIVVLQATYPLPVFGAELLQFARIRATELC